MGFLIQKLAIQIMRFWEKPEKEIINEIEFDEEGNPITRVRIRLFIKRGRIENYTVQLEHSLDKEWKQIVRFNYCHGFFHKDVYDKMGRIINKIDMGSHIDLKHAVDFGIKDINKNYKEYIRKFKKIRRKPE